MRGRKLKMIKNKRFNWINIGVVIFLYYIARPSWWRWCVPNSLKIALLYCFEDGVTCWRWDCRVGSAFLNEDVRAYRWCFLKFNGILNRELLNEHFIWWIKCFSFRKQRARREKWAQKVTSQKFVAYVCTMYGRSLRWQTFLTSSFEDIFFFKSMSCVQRPLRTVRLHELWIWYTYLWRRSVFEQRWNTWHGFWKNTCTKRQFLICYVKLYRDSKKNVSK